MHMYFMLASTASERGSLLTWYAASRTVMMMYALIYWSVNTKYSYRSLAISLTVPNPLLIHRWSRARYSVWLGFGLFRWVAWAALRRCRRPGRARQPPFLNYRRSTRRALRHVLLCAYLPRRPPLIACTMSRLVPAPLYTYTKWSIYPIHLSPLIVVTSRMYREWSIVLS
jgi:hypothetical protein